MEEYLFLDRDVIPDEKSLKKVLGKSFIHLEKIKAHIAETYGEVTEEWKFYSKKSGWTMKTLYKKRNLFFFRPYNGYFNVSFVFGDRAVEAVENSSVKEELKERLRQARKYAEGRGLQIQVSSSKYLPDIKKLLEIKTAN